MGEEDRRAHSDRCPTPTAHSTPTAQHVHDCHRHPHRSNNPQHTHNHRDPRGPPRAPPTPPPAATGVTAASTDSGGGGPRQVTAGHTPSPRLWITVTHRHSVSCARTAGGPQSTGVVLIQPRLPARKATQPRKGVCDGGHTWEHGRRPSPTPSCSTHSSSHTITVRCAPPPPLPHSHGWGNTTATTHTFRAIPNTSAAATQ